MSMPIFLGVIQVKRSIRSVHILEQVNFYRSENAVYLDFDEELIRKYCLANISLIFYIWKKGSYTCYLSNRQSDQIRKNTYYCSILLNNLAFIICILCGRFCVCFKSSTTFYRISRKPNDLIVN